MKQDRKTYSINKIIFYKNKNLKTRTIKNQRVINTKEKT